MPADGLTKILPRQKFTEFVRQLGFVNIATRIQRSETASTSDVNIIFLNREWSAIMDTRIELAL